MGGERARKIKIALHPQVRADIVTKLVTACLMILNRLGEATDLVENFDITFTSFNDGPYGPEIQMNFIDPLKNQFWFAVDFRYMGDGRPNPSVKEIVKCLYGHAVACINDHLDGYQKKLQEVQKISKGLKKIDPADE